MKNQDPSKAGHEPGHFSPLLLLLFVASGCSALIYEVVWFELLRLVIGASAISLAVLLGSFMGGMCIGSLGFARLVSVNRHPLKVYALLELAIGIFGIILIFFLPMVRDFYLQFVGHGQSSIFLRAAIAMVCLLPPTICMGATLPAISRWMENSKVGISRLGLFYMANIGGAVVGCLLAGFWLLRIYDMTIATFFAAALNGAVALIGYGLASFNPYSPPKLATVEKSKSKPPKGEAAKPKTHRVVYVVIMLSGLCALGAEVVWTRMLSLLFGATVYTFSVILAIFLIGLGIGSSIGSVLARYVPRPGIALAWCQLLVVASLPYAAYIITTEIPFWYVNPEFLIGQDFLADIVPRHIHDLIRGMVALLPATILFGASFPLALAAAAREDQDPGALVGGIYAANTVGAIIGSLLFSMSMIPAFGTQRTQQTLVVLAGISAFLMFGSIFLADLKQPKSRGLKNREGGLGKKWASALTGLAVVATLIVLLVKSVPGIPDGMIAYGRFSESWNFEAIYLEVGEGVNASVAVSDVPGNVRNFHVSGKVVASSEPIDMRLQRMLGHIPALLHPNPKRVLIVGCGAGVTAGSFVIHPEVEEIYICEIEPLVPEFAAKYFGPENYDVMSDPRTTIIYDDARHFITTTDLKFDIITSDPIHPWVRGAATMYSEEYYEICKEKLNPGGIVAQWVPLYETSEEAVKSELGTFMKVYPEGTIWNSDIYGDGYDVVMLGRKTSELIDVGQIARRIDENPAVQASLMQVNLGDVLELLGTYGGRGPDLVDYLSDAEINHDRSLRLQYLAGMALDIQQSESIYQEIVKFRRYPENLFAVPEWLEPQLREKINR